VKVICRIAVVGASLAGLSAARALRQQSYDGAVIAIGAERHEPYDRPPLSEDFLIGRCAESDLVVTAERSRYSHEPAELFTWWRRQLPTPGSRRGAYHMIGTDSSPAVNDLPQECA
jgi:cation diffusion facilitator CzcD-associated flavoprotein CzcO